MKIRTLLLYAARLLAITVAITGARAQDKTPILDSDGWQLSVPGLQYHFPADHQPHFNFKSEWWYFTGNLEDASHRRFGYQLTFFRQGMRPPSRRSQTQSDLIMNDLPFAHFCLSDPDQNRFLFFEKANRGAFGESGFGKEETLAWNGTWALRMDANQNFVMAADEGASSLHLTLRNSEKNAGQPGWLIQGANGVSQKSAGEGHASHYYSGPRMETEGSIQIEGKNYHVTGLSWFDHEWATNQLAPEQVGWNWFGIQLENGADLMLYQMRLRDGGVDPASSGALSLPGEKPRYLSVSDYKLTPVEYWVSPETKARYPIGWRVEIPSANLAFTVAAPLKNQELALPTLSYWEGMITVAGTANGTPITGRGYMELTGYASALTPLSGRQSTK